MSKFKNTVKSDFYWIIKGQGEIFKLLKSGIKIRGDYSNLADKLGTTKGYISQLMNGETDINPTWKKIVKLSLALDKVPILEFKNVNEYLIEQRIKSFMKSNITFNFQDTFPQNKYNSLERKLEYNLESIIWSNNFNILITKNNTELNEESYYHQFELI